MKNATEVKRRNPVKTKAKIIAAAQKLFSERGYSQTGLRDIAKLADVSSALPVRYFESKAGLFKAALHDALDLEAVLSVEKESFGKTLVQAVSDPNRPITIPAMTSLAIGDDEAALIVREFVKHNIISPMTKWLGPPHARARANLLLTISSGFVIYNRHIMVDGSPASKFEVATWLENTLQAIVDGSEQTLRAFSRSPDP